MRKSRIVLAGVAVATAAAAGTAFTAANTVPTSVAGYAQNTVSGVTVSDIAYTTATDPANLARVVFTATTDVTGHTATLTLRSGTTLVGSPYGCILGTWSGTSMSITCDTADNPAIASYNAVGLTVVQ